MTVAGLWVIAGAGVLAAVGVLCCLALAGQVLHSRISMDSGAVMPQNLLMDGIVYGGCLRWLSGVAVGHFLQGRIILCCLSAICIGSVRLFM